MNQIKRITINPSVLLGKPTIRGLRISVDQIIKALAAGLSTEEILEDYKPDKNIFSKNYPELEKEDITASLLYVSKILESEKIYSINV